jgi:hypothetical protein
MCYALRLHMSAAPPQGGLTQALGCKKASVADSLMIVLFAASLSSLFYHLFRSSLRSFQWTCCGSALMPLRALLRLRARGCAHAHVGLYALRGCARGAGLRVVDNSSGGRVEGSAFGPLFGLRRCCSPSRLRAGRAPNNSFKPTPHRGVGHVPALR